MTATNHITQTLTKHRGCHFNVHVDHERMDVSPPSPKSPALLGCPSSPTSSARLSTGLPILLTPRSPVEVDIFFVRSLSPVSSPVRTLPMFTRSKSEFDADHQRQGELNTRVECAKGTISTSIPLEDVCRELDRLARAKWITKGPVAPVKNQGQCSFYSSLSVPRSILIVTMSSLTTPLFPQKNSTCTGDSYSYATTKGTCKTSICTVDHPGKCHKIQRGARSERHNNQCPSHIHPILVVYMYISAHMFLLSSIVMRTLSFSQTHIGGSRILSEKQVICVSSKHAFTKSPFKRPPLT